MLVVAGHEERRSRSRLRGPVEAPRRKPREDELEEAWRIADAEREAELKDRERDLARRERMLVESLRKGKQQREAARSPPRASPSARRRRSPSGKRGAKGAEGEPRRRWTRRDKRSSRSRSRSRSPRRSMGESREQRSKGAFESNRDGLDTVQRRRDCARGGRRGRSSSGSSAGGRHQRRSRSPSVFRGASSSTGKSIHERPMAWSEEYRGAWPPASSSGWGAGWDGTARQRCGTRRRRRLRHGATTSACSSRSTRT